MKTQELRDKSSEELKLEHETLLKEIYQLRGQGPEAKLDKTHLIKEKRRTSARILTILTDRESKAMKG